MDDIELKLAIEALLMTSKKPLSLDKIHALFADYEKPSLVQIKKALDRLQQDYHMHAVELKCTASGYCLQTKQRFKGYVSRLLAEKPSQYSAALLETLAIIAYRQPVTRADIENIRGVTVSGAIIKTLLEREWIRQGGYRDVPGKPAVYVTTKTFLDYFNLTNLHELPQLQFENK